VQKNGPFFNLKAVVQQTGVKPDTLRAWERRYGLPSPTRSGGGHRLYSPRDIDTIKWLMTRQAEGLSISRAVELWQQIETEGRDPLQAATPIVVQAGPPRPLGGTITQLRTDWIDACLGYDERRAEQIVNQAFAMYAPETVCLDLLQTAVAEIGDGWYQGHVTVQQEHFCSELAVRRFESLILSGPPPTRPGRILVACPPGESHVLGLLLATHLLRRRGREVVYLGASVPVDQVERTVAATRPRLAILAAQRLHTAATLLDMAEALEREDVPLAYGGRIFNLLPRLRERVPGHFLGERLELVPEAVESLMVAPRPTPETAAIPEASRQAREHYLDRQRLIEVDLVQFLNETGVAPRHVVTASSELAQSIAAALRLGDMDLVGTDIDWAEGLLRSHGLPARMPHGYLKAYYEAARRNLDERGKPIIAWFGEFVGGTSPTHGEA
jgi:DNA-binding transcriptional MerR regulator